MDKNQNFEELMGLYQVEEGSDNLAGNIIAAARSIPQKQSLGKWINNIFAEFSLPAPAYSLASFLLVGFFVGFLSFEYTSNSNTNSHQVIELWLGEGEELI